jgi:site-specific recombinase XerD
MSDQLLLTTPRVRSELISQLVFAKGLYKIVKKLGVIASVEDIRPHRFRHDFGTSIARKGLDTLYGKELMGIKSDKVYCRYTQRALFISGG